MTTIAWDGTTLAADKRCSNNGIYFPITKIQKIRGHLVGGCGDTVTIQCFFHWFRKGALSRYFPEEIRNGDCHAIVITPDKNVLMYEKSVHPFISESKHAAIGSGASFALAAMYLGTSAIGAIEVASAFDMQTGNGIDILTF